MAKGKKPTTLRLDTSAFADLLVMIERTGGSVREAAEDALQQAAETIRDDTIEAMRDENLPAKGKYRSSTHRTEESIIRDTTVRWEGQTAWVPVGFDFDKPGAGGYLISGTPRMKPDYKLNRMYRQKAYMRGIQNDVRDVLLDYIVEEMEGKT